MSIFDSIYNAVSNLSPKNILDRVFSSSPAPSVKGATTSPSDAPGTVAGFFESVGSSIGGTVGQATASALKPVFPMLIVLVVVGVGTFYVLQKVK